MYKRTRPKMLARKTGPYFLKALSKNCLGVAEYSFVLPYSGLEYGTSGGKRCSDYNHEPELFRNSTLYVTTRRSAP